MRLELPKAFFPARARALWAPSSAKRCVYLVEPMGRTRAVWRAPAAERLVGLGWAPAGNTFVATTTTPAGTRAYVVHRDGRMRERWAADGIAFYSDGSKVVMRAGALHLRHRGDARRLVRLDAIRAAAGLGEGASVAVGPDRHGFRRGYGRRAVVATLYAGAGPRPAQAHVLVTRDGAVRRLGPVFASDATGVPGGSAWSPDGDSFVQVVGELPGNAGLSLGHDHCLDLWTPREGYRRLVCGSRLPQRSHFDRVVWSANGSAFLLNNGARVSRRGEPRGRVAVPPLAFELQWTY